MNELSQYAKSITHVPEGFTPEEAVEEHRRREYIRYFAAIMRPDGRTIFVRNGHTNTLAAIYGNGDMSRAWADMPIDAHPMGWLVEKTGCIVIDYNGVIMPENTTADQFAALELYRRSGMIGKGAEYGKVGLS